MTATTAGIKSVSKARAPIYPLNLNRLILIGFALLGIGVSVWRWTAGLGVTSFMADARPWGIWIGFDLLVGIAISAGAFILAASVHIFGLKQFEPILRPAILTGFLGYLMAVLALLVDLGQSLRIWHLILYWNVHSPLFEVGWCVMMYLTVLALEFSPAVFEKFGWKVPLRIVRAISIPLMITGIVLSTMHQSSLGTLWMAIPGRVHPLWYSPLVPVDFLVSAMAAGMSMVVIEANLSAIAYNFRFEREVLSSLVRAIPYILGIYLLLKLVELVFLGNGQYFLQGGLPAILYATEILVGVVLPLVLFSLRRVRETRSGMVWTAVLVLFGLVLNRFDTSLIFFKGAPYLPAWSEIAVSVGYICLGVVLFDVAAHLFPVFEHSSAHAK